MKYLLCKPEGGFIDNLRTIEKCLEYCLKFNRILLINTCHSFTYRINFSDYFNFKKLPIICDLKKIKYILSKRFLTVYPSSLKKNILNFKVKKDKKNNYYWIGDKNKKPLIINFKKKYNFDILVVQSSDIGGDSFKMFKLLRFNNNIIKDFIEKFNKIDTPYLCIQIRNTDRDCDYKKLYYENQELIKNQKVIYIATDDFKALEFFRTKNLNIFNFTTFPKNNRPLHYSLLNSDLKIKDCISDLILIGLSNILLSNSIGGYIRLAKEINKNKEIIFDKINDNKLNILKSILQKRKIASNNIELFGIINLKFNSIKITNKIIKFLI